ncbi:DUF7500 family protein [Natronomonas sp.]|uniref:DUF7500 family protein n=1 Tax=Natronomonas sp. TaxID=2184060 RepID=UPI00262CEA96|nr:hypothetical protein [Natronomonas sp.]
MSPDIPTEPEEDDDDYVDPDLPTEPESAEEGGPALSPEELDIADSEYVEELDESGRYVVSPGGGPPNVPRSESDSASGSESEGTGRRRERAERAGGRPSPDRPEPERPSGGMRSPEAARTLLADELERSNARYGIDIVARFDGDTVRHRSASDDVIATFENLVQWYARHVTDGTPADEVIEILLREASFVESETPNLAKLLKTHDLDRSDSIAELVAAIREESG